MFGIEPGPSGEALRVPAAGEDVPKARPAGIEANGDQHERIPSRTPLHACYLYPVGVKYQHA